MSGDSAPSAGAGVPAADCYHVIVQFRPGGPVVEGTWPDGGLALRKFRGWVGTHGSTDGVIIGLWTETATACHRHRTWTSTDREIVHPDPGTAYSRRASAEVPKAQAR